MVRRDDTKRWGLCRDWRVQGVHQAISRDRGIAGNEVSRSTERDSAWCFPGARQHHFSLNDCSREHFSPSPQAYGTEVCKQLLTHCWHPHSPMLATAQAGWWVTMLATFLFHPWLQPLNSKAHSAGMQRANWQWGIAGGPASSPLAVPDAVADGLPSPALQRHPLAITTPQLPCVEVSLVLQMCAEKII